MIDLAAHPWISGLFGDDEIATLFSPEAELQRFLSIEAAWSQSLGELEGDDIAAEVSRAILAADIKPEDLKPGFARDGVPIPALVAALKSKLPPETEKWVHVGLTSQDVMDTAMILAVRAVMAVLSKRLNALNHMLNELRRRFGRAELMAITRMQPALPTNGETLIARWQQPLPILLKDLRQAREDLRVIQWGGPIGTRGHPQADKLAGIFAEKLSLRDPGGAWHTDRTLISQFAHIMSRITILTGKIGEDIALMAALGAEQITLSGGTSSAIPHKNNPIKAEALISLSTLAGHLQGAFSQSGRHEGFRSGKAWVLEWLTLPQLCLITSSSLKLAIVLLEEIENIGERPSQ